MTCPLPLLTPCTQDDSRSSCHGFASIPSHVPFLRISQNRGRHNGGDEPMASPQERKNKPVHVTKYKIIDSEEIIIHNVLRGFARRHGYHPPM